MARDNPHDWNPQQIDEAFAYFVEYYGPGGLYEEFFAGQQPVTCDEFLRAVLEDYDAAMQGETTHPLPFVSGEGKHFWEWASVERESVRDRVLIARGHRPIGYDADGSWLDGRFDSETDREET